MWRPVIVIATAPLRNLQLALGCLAGAALSLAVLDVPARAQESDWLRFGMGGNSGYASQTYDREFIKQWESNPPLGFPTLSKLNLPAMSVAIRRYEAIVKAGGWLVVPDVKALEGKSLQVAQAHPIVAVVRARLAASGDYDGPASTQPYFDQSLEKAVKRYQASNGLTPTGVVDERTVAAMNVPADVRLKQLKVNLPRISELAASRPRKYVVVNIPAAQVEAVEADKVISRHTGVVGKTERPTPLLKSKITSLNFNPVWTLPPTVIDKDLIPKGRDMQARNQNVLLKYGIDAYDASGRKLDPGSIDWSSATPHNLVYKQQPGKENPLGFLKINFDSENSVYMHDTPHETLFGKNVRAASSGCVRVHNIDVLAAWLLAPQGWTEEHIHIMKENGERKDVTLKQPVALNFIYITAWATPDGVVQFRRDLYNRDGVGPVAASY